jgi:hypothetical protein
MANVNLKTGKIYGCKEGTKTYYHELGHLEFEEHAPKGNLIRQLQDLSIKALLFILGLNVIYPLKLFKWLTLACILISCFTEIFEEAWCWKYANVKRKEVSERGEQEQV